MNPIHPLLHGSIDSLIAIGLAGVANTALAAKGDTEKCAGVTKAGKNDCGTSKSACAGTAAKAPMKLPTGVRRAAVMTMSVTGGPPTDACPLAPAAARCQASLRRSKPLYKPFATLA